MNRREFISLIGAAVGWPLAARAQQPVLPVIGFLSSRSLDVDASLLTAFHQGLAEVGFVEGRSVTIEYRWAKGRYDQLPMRAAELVRKPVAVLVSTGGTVSARPRRLRPGQSPSSSRPLMIRSKSGLSTASTSRVVTSPASPHRSSRLRRNDWSFCKSCYPRRPRSAFL